jgi:hypothetical protein
MLGESELAELELATDEALGRVEPEAVAPGSRPAFVKAAA